jgi:glycosyltransferase involved in cell wall biosynthesis
MPVRNGARFLPAALKSIRGQSFKDWRLVAIDDGSTDASADIIRTHHVQDTRVELWDFRYKGFAHALNQALAITRTHFVVRMDCDDIMLPCRLDKQFCFMQSNPDLCVSGSYVYYINEAGKRVGQGTSTLSSDSALEACLQSGDLVGFHHSTAIFQRQAVMSAGGYRTDAWPVEDVALWTHLAEQGQRIRVQPEYLLEYRIHRSGSRTFERLERVEWLKSNRLRRMAGSEDLSWEQYRKQIQLSSLLNKYSYYRRLLGKRCYKDAASEFANGHILHAAALLFGSVLFKPLYAAKQLRSRTPRLSK